MEVHGTRFSTSRRRLIPALIVAAAMVVVAAALVRAQPARFDDVVRFADRAIVERTAAGGVVIREWRRRDEIELEIAAVGERCRGLREHDCRGDRRCQDCSLHWNLLRSAGVKV